MLDLYHLDPNVQMEQMIRLSEGQSWRATGRIIDTYTTTSLRTEHTVLIQIEHIVNDKVIHTFELSIEGKLSKAINLMGEFVLVQGDRPRVDDAHTFNILKTAPYTEYEISEPLIGIEIG